MAFRRHPLGKLWAPAHTPPGCVASLRFTRRRTARPGEVRLALRIEAARDPSGDIQLRYALWIPERALSMHGRVSLTPGVEQELPLGDGTLVASILALPVPSAAFDAYLEAEGARRAMGRTS